MTNAEMRMLDALEDIFLCAVSQGVGCRSFDLVAEPKALPYACVSGCVLVKMPLAGWAGGAGGTILV